MKDTFKVAISIQGINHKVSVSGQGIYQKTLLEWRLVDNGLNFKQPVPEIRRSYLKQTHKKVKSTQRSSTFQEAEVYSRNYRAL